ncbi:MAG TPA: TetR/AcrR family transcriptional regulator [Rugosimonospora sp.]|nr:TetR/AcrR family transcriptional regulator [Rugosimonospora sp.]
MASPPQRRRAARHQQPLADGTHPTRRGPSAGRKKPITVDAIIDTAFGIVAREGYGALTMRRVAGTLETGPASLYAHVVNKEDLDDLLIGRLCAEIELPQPDPRTWREQITRVCTQLRDQYLRYPGISLAALAVVPTNLETLRVSEGMLGIVLAGGVEPQAAAWAVDALLLYVNACCLEASLTDRHVDQDGRAAGRDDLLRRFAALPDTFPHTKRYAAELTSGTAHDRFGFTLNLILGGLGPPRLG